jgi:hypothetical protein
MPRLSGKRFQELKSLMGKLKAEERRIPLVQNIEFLGEHLVGPH